MPNEYRVRQVNRLENVGAPAVITFQALQRPGQGPCMRSQEWRFVARRNCNLLSQSVETNIDATRIPQYGLEWTAREEHV